MENNIHPPNDVVIDLVNVDDDEHPDNEEINVVDNDFQRQRQIEEAEEAEEERLYEVERLRSMEISHQMTTASVSNYVPTITQINLVKDGMSIEKALTESGDNITPCERCGHRDPESCFWVMAKIDLNIEGQRMSDRRPTWRGANVRHYLYGHFIDDQYNHMQGPANRLMRAGILPRVPLRLPRLPLPICIETYIKRIFPNEDNAPFVGFRPRQRRGRGNNSRSRRNA